MLRRLLSAVTLWRDSRWPDYMCCPLWSLLGPPWVNVISVPVPCPGWGVRTTMIAFSRWYNICQLLHYWGKDCLYLARTVCTHTCTHWHTCACTHTRAQTHRHTRTHTRTRKHAILRMSLACHYYLNFDSHVLTVHHAVIRCMGVEMRFAS